MKAARIVILVVAVGAGGLAAMLMGKAKAPPPAPVKPTPQVATVDVLVAKGDIPMGTVVSAQDMQWQTWPVAAAAPVFIRRADKPNAIDQFAGSIARAPFVGGEPMRESKLIKANGSGFMAAILPPGMRAISTDITPETGAGGFILPNDHVDVILTRREADRATGESHTSETILTNVRVLAIDQTVEEKNGQRVVVGKTATLELAPHQAETLALARQLGTLSLALRSLADANAPETPIPDDAKGAGRRGTINMVRFGATSTTTPK